MNDLSKYNFGGRGHVIALAIFCAIDAISSYFLSNKETEKCCECGRGDNVGPRYKEYIKRFFPEPYNNFAEKLYILYRCTLTHNWNLFEIAITPSYNQDINAKDIHILGLKEFFKALSRSVCSAFDEFDRDENIKSSYLHRYKNLRKIAKKL